MALTLMRPGTSPPRRRGGQKRSSRNPASKIDDITVFAPKGLLSFLLMGSGQFCCFPSPGYVIGGGPPSGPPAGAAAPGAGYGSRSVPVPVPATSQIMVASNMPPTMVPAALSSNQIPITTVPSTNVYVPTYGQASVINAPYAAEMGQPGTGNIVAPVQPYGISSIAH